MICKTDHSINIAKKKSDLCVPHGKQSGSIATAFPAVPYLMP